MNLTRTAVLALSLSLLTSMHGQTVQLLSLDPSLPAKPMPGDYDPQKPDQDRFPEEAELTVPALTYFPAPAHARTGTSIIICPGGGYVGEAVDKEGYRPAEWLNSLGISAFVLRYRLPLGKADENTRSAPLHDLEQAIVLVRANAAAWGLDPKRVGVMGWSAGGHLAATGGTLFHPQPVKGPDGKAYSDRPDFLVLMYSVITMGLKGHSESRERLLGKHPSAAALERYSAEDQVTSATPPTFLVVTRDDEEVPFQNSVMFADACKKAGVACTFMLYEHGRHGFGMGIPGTDSAAWPEAFTAWARAGGLLAKPAP
jgi:acetyl esterase/lipase